MCILEQQKSMQEQLFVRARSLLQALSRGLFDH